jgi:hypothetical protein
MRSMADGVVLAWAAGVVSVALTVQAVSVTVISDMAVSAGVCRWQGQVCTKCDIVRRGDVGYGTFWQVLGAICR